MIYLYFY